MKQPINYYYYYYGGSYSNESFNSKDYEIQQIVSFLEESTNSIFKICKNTQVVKFASEAIKNVQIDQWAEDIEISMRKGIRDLKMGLLPNDDFNHTWRSLDSYGLTGTQLKNKLAVWRDIKKYLDNFKDNFLDSIKSPWFSEALDFLTTLLGSIGKVLLKEYIEQLQELINTVKYIIKKS